jgi:hypothetical protein
MLAPETKHIQNGSSQGQSVVSALGILQFAFYESKFGSKDACVPTDILHFNATNSEALNAVTASTSTILGSRRGNRSRV